MQHLIEVVAANPGLFCALALLILEQILPHVGTPQVNSTMQLLAAFLKRKAGPTILLLAVVSLSACAQGYAASYAGLTAAERINEAAADQFPALDKEKRAGIVRIAKSEAEGKELLAAWDLTAERLVKAVEGTHASVQLARDALAEIKSGLRDKRQLGGWVSTAIQLGIELKDILAASGVPLRGL